MNYNQNNIATDGGTEFHVTQQQNESVTQAILRGVATVTGTSELDLDTLYSSIDPNLVAELLRHSDRHDSDVSIEFTYENCIIEIRDDGKILITDSLSNIQ